MDPLFLAHLIAMTLTDTPFPDMPKALPLLLGTAAVESGLLHLRQLGGGPALGLFQMEPTTAVDHWHYIVKHPHIEEVFHSRAGVTGPSIIAQTHNMVYQILLCRLHYYVRSPEALPGVGDVEGQARYWKRYYNTQAGKGTVEAYQASYERLVAPVFATAGPPLRPDAEPF